jgi:predicted nucleotidyltransferase
MKFDKPLDDIFSAPSNVKVLRVFFRNKFELTGRQIAELAGLNAMTCQNTLHRLRDFKLVYMRPVGSAHLYRLSRDSILVKNLLEPAFEAERSLLNDLVAPLIENLGSSLRSLIVFGSVARGEEDFISDLDIAVIVNNRSNMKRVQEIVDRETDSLSGATGSVTTVLVYTVNEFQTRYRRGQSLFRTIVEAGRVVFGTSLESLIHHDREKTSNSKGVKKRSQGLPSKGRRVSD